MIRFGLPAVGRASGSTAGGGLQVQVHHNFDQVQRALEQDYKQARFAAAVAMNKAVEWAETAVRKDMRSTFHQPTPFFLRSLRRIRATTRADRIEAGLWFKDYEATKSTTTGEAMVLPHIEGGTRRHKKHELRLQAAGLMPRGWYAVPGQAAEMDGNGNMSRGQLSTILNVLGTYTEAGYNKANAKTLDRLRKGNAKRNQYGYAYWVNPAGGQRGAHLPPGIYKRVFTGFGTSLKPVLIFVSRATYRRRFDFYAIANKAFEDHFPREFDKAWDMALRTAR